MGLKYVKGTGRIMSGVYVMKSQMKAGIQVIIFK